MAIGFSSFETLDLDTQNFVLAIAAQQYRENGDTENYQVIVQKLTTNNMALAVEYANRHGRRYLEHKDRFQAGVLGQLESAQDLDPSVGSYDTHARDHMRRSISQTSYEALRAPMSQDIFQRRGMINRADRELTQILGKTPNEYEIANYVNEQNPHLRNKIRPYQVRRFLSSNAHLEPPNYRGVNSSIPERLSYKQMIDRVRDVLYGDTLKPEEKRLIFEHYGFFGEEKSLQEIADERTKATNRQKPLSRAAVSKQHRQILDKLHLALIWEFNGNIGDLVLE